MKNARAIIIGGGISGLSLAFFLHKKNYTVRLYEKSDRVGGTIRSSRVGGYLVEHGPNSTLQKPGDVTDALGRLLADVQLAPAVAATAANKRFILKKQRLLPLPLSPAQFFSTPIFSWRGKVRLFLEPFISPALDEESIRQFVIRRLGLEFLQYAIDPFVSGVYAGDPAKLSVQAAVPKIYALEAQHGSLIRGAMAMRKKHQIDGLPKGRLISFADGMESLPKRIAEKLPEGSVKINTDVRTIRLVAGQWQMAGEHNGAEFQETADHLILAIPSHQAAPLIEPFSQTAARLLAGIHYPPIVSVALGYRRSQIKHPMDGFGFLVPEVEGEQVLGTLFSSTLFANRADASQVLLTNFIGGAKNLNILKASDGEIVNDVLQALLEPLGLHGTPDFTEITRHAQAIPQYELGHLPRLRQIEDEMRLLPRLFFRCNWQNGISVSDCVYNSEQLAEKIAKEER